MPNLNRPIVLLLALALVFGMATTAMAQDEAAATPDASGTLVGDTGGAYQTWNLSLPSNQDVTLTLTHWPCNTGGAIGLNVWGPSGKLAGSSASDACTEMASFNTGDGGSATIQLYNYMHGVGTWWALDAEGISLGAAPAAPAAPAATEAEAATDSTAAAGENAMAGESAMTDTTATTEAAAAPAAPAAAAPAAGSLSVGDSLFGDAGGAYDNYNLTVQEGSSYTVEMTIGTDRGGNWPGVGFDVWGPSGHVARGSWVDNDTLSATFTANGDVVYLIQPYNYHHGLTLFYSLEAMAQ